MPTGAAIPVVEVVARWSLPCPSHLRGQTGRERRALLGIRRRRGTRRHECVSCPPNFAPYATKRLPANAGWRAGWRGCATAQATGGDQVGAEAVALGGTGAQERLVAVGGVGVRDGDEPFRLVASRSDGAASRHDGDGAVDRGSGAIGADRRAPARGGHAAARQAARLAPQLLARRRSNMAARVQLIRRPRSQQPTLGEWEGPIYGELGVLAVEPDGDRVQCHACGKWFRFLATHVWQRHVLTADEYRAIFGLKTTTGLMSPNLKQKRRELTAPILSQFFGAGIAVLRAMSDEEWRGLHRGERWRLEGRLDPHNRATWQKKMAKDGKCQSAWREKLQDPEFKAVWRKHVQEAQGGPVFFNCSICGKRFRMKPSDAARAHRHACSKECRQLLFRDPGYRAELSAGVSQARGGRVPVACDVCGRGFEITQSAAKNWKHHFCGRGCWGEWQRRRFASEDNPRRKAMQQRQCEPAAGASP